MKPTKPIAWRSRQPSMLDRQNYLLAAWVGNLRDGSGVVRQARYLADKNGIATDIPNPDYVAVRR